MSLQTTELPVSPLLNRMITAGEDRYGAGDLSGAAEMFLRAVQMAPDCLEAWNNLGVVFLALGDLQKALETFGHALSMSPTDRDTLLNLHAALSNEGLDKEAAEVLGALEAHHGSDPAVLPLNQVEDPIKAPVRENLIEVRPVLSLVAVVQEQAVLDAWLASLEAQTLPPGRFEVIVVEPAVEQPLDLRESCSVSVRIIKPGSEDQDPWAAGLAEARSPWVLNIDPDVPLAEDELLVRYEGLVSAAKTVPPEIVAESRLSREQRIGSSTRPPRFDVSNVTFAIKTFLRPKSLDLLIRSIRLFYPDARIMVADDGREPTVRTDVEQYLVMPFDQGLSAGRNLMLDHIETEFAMLLDDDTVFTEATRVEYALDVFARSESIDLVAGRYLPDVFYGGQVIEDGVFVRDIRQCREVVDGFPVYDFLPNFFVARAEKLRQIRWDEDLKLQEHMEFFWRARGRLTGIYLPYFSSLNSHINENNDYRKYRQRFEQFQTMQAEKLGVKSITSRVSPSNLHEHSVCDLALMPQWLSHGEGVESQLVGEIRSAGSRDKTEYPANVISDEQKAVFIHVPKTAGISMKMALFDAKKGAHARMNDIKNDFPEVAERYFSFGFVRNPWDRLVSAFFFLSKGGTGNSQDRMLYRRVFEQYDGDFGRFVREFVRAESIAKVIHLRPQWEFLCDSHGAMLVDFVGRFEALQEGFNEICHRLEISPIELQRTNASSHSRYQDHYDDETRAIVEFVYRKDIEMFGYTFD